MLHAVDVQDLIARWGAGQASGNWDLDTVWGPLRAVTHALKETGGAARSTSTPRLSLADLPPEADLEQAREDNTAVVIDAAWVQVVHTPHGWRIIDILQQGTWVSERFCVHGSAQVRSPAGTQPGISVTSLAAHVTGESSNHRLRVVSDRGEDVQLTVGEQPGFLLRAREAVSFQTPSAAGREVLLPVTARTAGTGLLKRGARVDQLQLALHTPEGHPRRGWCSSST